MRDNVYPSIAGIFHVTVESTGWSLIQMAIDRPEMLDMHMYLEAAIETVLHGLYSAAKHDPSLWETIERFGHMIYHDSEIP